MIRRGERRVREGGLSGLGSGSVFLPVLSLLRTKVWMDTLVSGQIGSVHLPPWSSRRFCQGQERQAGKEARDPCSRQAASRNPRHLPKPRQSIRAHSWRADRCRCADALGVQVCSTYPRTVWAAVRD